MVKGPETVAVTAEAHALVLADEIVELVHEVVGVRRRLDRWIQGGEVRVLGGLCGGRDAGTSVGHQGCENTAWGGQDGVGCVVGIGSQGLCCTRVWCWGWCGVCKWMRRVLGWVGLRQ